MCKHKVSCFLQPVMEADDEPGASPMFHNRAQYMFVLAPSRTVVAYTKALEGIEDQPPALVTS